LSFDFVYLVHAHAHVRSFLQMW